ncbi:MAG: exosortase [Colwellia sp.]|nr:exosortase [Colwellia sp.]
MKSNIHFLGIITLFILFWLLNLPVITTLWRHSFDDGTYSHAYLIPFITLYLYYQLQSDGLLVYKSNFSWLGFILLCISCYGLFIAASAQISVGYWLSSLAILISAIIMLYQYHWRVIFPAAFLILIIPMWGPLAVILQSMSVDAVNVMMGFTGIPTYVEGNLVSIPSGVFEIAGGCSGLRYFIVSIAISSLFVFLNMMNIRNMILFISVAIIGSLITNWIRITLLIIIGDYTDMTSSLMTDHNNFGWYIYAPFMVLLFVLGNRLAESNSTDIPKSTDTDRLKPCPAIKIHTILLVSLGLLISSTTISNNLITEQHLISNSLEEYKKQQELEPFVQYYTRVDTSILTIKNTSITMKTYYFSGYDLDAKPTFYTNQSTPDSWRINNDYQYKQWNILEVKQNSQRSLVATSLQLNEQLYAIKRNFKMARIKAGLTGIRETKSHWLTVPCRTDCTLEKKILTQALNAYKIIN